MRGVAVEFKMRKFDKVVFEMCFEFKMREVVVAKQSFGF